MRKYLSIIISLLIIIQISNINFAAVVSDNDGTAFVTKGEFDTLKNYFQSQISSYNSSIDNKIDGSIASYLSGVQLALQEEMENYYEKYKVPGSSGLAWTASPSYIDNKNSTQLTGWDVNFECLASAGFTSTKYLSHCNVKKDTYEVRVYFDGGKITGLYEWEPMMTGCGMAMDFYPSSHTDASTIPVYEGKNEFLWYNNITLSKDNRKNGVVGNGGTFNKTYYEGTQWNITYTEKTKDSKVPFVISPKSDADEYYINIDDTYTWGATATTDLIDPFTDKSFTNSGWVKDANAAVKIKWNAGGSRMKGYVNITSEKRNEMTVKQFEDICSENGAMKYGVVLSKVDKNGNMSAKIKCSGDGNVKIWVGDKTTDYAASTNKADFLVTAGTIVPISLTKLVKGDYIRIMYEPTIDIHTMDVYNLVLVQE